MRTVAAYIDLNAVRAGIVDDPKDYRFCGYGCWVGGDSFAAEGFRKIFHTSDPAWAKAQYRQILYGKGALSKADESSGKVLNAEAARQVLQSGGQLSESERLLCRARYFRDGCVLGSREFITQIIPHLRQTGATHRKSDRTFLLPGFKESGLSGFRQLRKGDV